MKIKDFSEDAVAYSLKYAPLVNAPMKACNSNQRREQAFAAMETCGKDHFSQAENTFLSRWIEERQEKSCHPTVLEHAALLHLSETLACPQLRGAAHAAMKHTWEKLCEVPYPGGRIIKPPYLPNRVLAIEDLETRLFYDTAYFREARSSALFEDFKLR